MDDQSQLACSNTEEELRSALLLTIQAAEQKALKASSRLSKFICFDLGLVTMLWIIFTATSSEDVAKAFHDQVIVQPANLYVKYSLFDVVLLSLVRVCWLAVCYGLLRICHWLPVSATVALTTIYLVLKIVVAKYDFSKNTGLAIAVCVSSFVISWIELWLVDFRWIPHQRKTIQLKNRVENGDAEQLICDNGDLTDDAERFQTVNEGSSSSDDNERPYRSKSFSKGTRRSHSRVSTASVASASIVNVGFEISLSNEECLRLAQNSMQLSRRLYAKSAQWNQTSADPLIFSHNLKEFGRLFLLKMYHIPLSATRMFQWYWSPTDVSWNTGIMDFQIVRQINECTDITYSVSAPAAAGAIQCRDFVDVRHCIRETGETYYISGISLPQNSCAPRPNRTRGENGPNLVIIRVDQSDNEYCTLEWMFNTNLKGRLPRSLVDRALNSFLAKFAKELKMEIEKIALSAEKE